MAWWKVETDKERAERRGTKEAKPKAKTSKEKRTVRNDLADTKEIIAELRAISKRVSVLKKLGTNNPQLDNLLGNISDESYKICLKC